MTTDQDISSGVWLKTRFYREGPFLCATVYSVAAGNPQVFTAKVDLRPIERAVRRYHLKLHAEAAEAARSNPTKRLPAAGANTADVSGLFSGISHAFKSVAHAIGHAAQKLGRVKLLQQVGKIASTVIKETKAVVRSSVTKWALTGLSVVAPEIGLPALAAYTAANAAFSAVDSGRNAVNAVANVVGARKLFSDASAAVKKIGPAAAAASLTAHPALKQKIQTAAAVVKAGSKLSPAIVANAVSTQKDALAKMKTIIDQTKSADPAIRDAAQKSLDVLHLVAQSRERMRGIAAANVKGLPGLHIDASGKITKGRFLRTGPGSEYLYGAKGNQDRQGTFKKVGCGSYVGAANPTDIIGCGNVRGYGLLDIAESNPFPNADLFMEYV